MKGHSIKRVKGEGSKVKGSNVKGSKVKGQR